MSGLSVNPLSYYSSYYPQKNATNAQTALKNLGTALQSGNLSSAQVAFAALQQATRGNNQGGMNRAISADMTNLGNALSANNLASAQSTFAQLHTDIVAQRGQPQSPAGGVGGAIQSLMSQLLPSSATATTTGATTPTTSGTTPGILNVLA
jgi:hypothetical protein